MGVAVGSSGVGESMGSTGSGGACSAASEGGPVSGGVSVGVGVGVGVGGGVGVLVGVGLGVKVGVRGGVKVKVGCRVLKGVGVGVATWTSKAPAEQARLEIRLISVKRMKRVEARLVCSGRFCVIGLLMLQQQKIPNPLIRIRRIRKGDNF